MGRPKTDTIEFFSHDVYASEGRTLTVLEGAFHNDGYTFWFKLLERLGIQEGHFYDANKPGDLAYLAQKCKVDTDTATKILNMCADELEAIDTELWQKYRVIWCEKFVKRLEPVYKKRGRPLPKRPIRPIISVTETPPTPPISVTETQQSPKPDTNPPSIHNVISVTETPPTPPISGAEITSQPPILVQLGTESTQSRVEESIVKESTTTAVAERVVKVDEVLAGMSKVFMENIGMITPMIAEDLKELSTEIPLTWFEDAVKEAVNSGVRNMKYVRAIIERWKVQGRNERRPNNVNGRPESTWQNRNFRGTQRKDEKGVGAGERELSYEEKQRKFLGD